MIIQRQISREMALKILYQNEFHDKPTERQINSSIENVFEEKDISEKEKKYTLKLLKDFYAHKEHIDNLIELHSTNWKIDRMALIDLNILRIAILEILHFSEIPSKVSINEALELSKSFGSKNSASFINGILDKVLKTQNTAPKS